MESLQTIGRVIMWMRVISANLQKQIRLSITNNLERVEMKILKTGAKHHAATLAAHAMGKTGHPPHVGKRHEDKKSNHGPIARASAPKRSAAG